MINTNKEILQSLLYNLDEGAKIPQGKIDYAQERLDDIIDLKELEYNRNNEGVTITIHNNIAFDNYNKVSVEEIEENLLHLCRYGLINDEDIEIINSILSNAKRLNKLVREKYVAKLDKEHNLFKKKSKRLNNK